MNNYMIYKTLTVTISRDSKCVESNYKLFINKTFGANAVQSVHKTSKSDSQNYFYLL